MRILVDTNILIHREEYQIVPESLQQLMRNLSSLGITVLIHPGSISELERNPDAEKRKIAISKVKSYPILESPPTPESDQEYLEGVGNPRTANDLFDITLLYAVYRNAVDFLITEDQGIHIRAMRINKRDQVLSIEESLSFFKIDEGSVITELLPAVKEEFVYNLDYNDSILDSLKSEYPGFKKWWEKISSEGRKAVVGYNTDESMSALLITKIENESILTTPPIPPKKRLKICTFIVKNTGQKIGELFVKKSIQICLKNSIDEMYLTHFTKPEDYLVSLIGRFGFERVSKIGNEDVYMKHLVPAKSMRELIPSTASKNYYPTFYDGFRVKKFIVPIIPKYHERLFTEYIGRQTEILEHSGGFIIEGNTIDKVYLSHSSIRSVDSGDLLLFYRSKDSKELTSIGVVERVFVNRNSDYILKQIGKRSVYSIEEIREMSKKPTLVILFRWHFHFPEPIGIEDLKDMRIIKQAPQSITKIGHSDYLKILKRSKLDERYTIHQT